MADSSSKEVDKATEQLQSTGISPAASSGQLIFLWKKLKFIGSVKIFTFIYATILNSTIENVEIIVFLLTII